MTETVLQWLAGVEGLQGLKPEQLDAASGSCGLFCKGEQLLWEKRDILGGRLRRRKRTFLLVIHRPAGSLCPMETIAQKALASAPVFGEDQTVAMENARLSRDTGLGIARHQMEITFTFTTKEV